MMVGGSSDITYDSRVTLKSGASGQGASVVAAPPVFGRAFQHQRACAGAGQVGRGDEAVVPAADDDRVVVLGTHEPEPPKD